MAGPKRDDQGETLTRTRVEKPPKFKVLIFNDDFTTMEFVTWILQNVFHHTPASAHRLMIGIHRAGMGVAGVYVREVAETKVEQTLSSAREAGHPLMCTLEPE